MRIIPRDQLAREIGEWVTRDLTSEELTEVPADETDIEAIGNWLSNDLLKCLLDQKGYTVVDLNMVKIDVKTDKT